MKPQLFTARIVWTGNRGQGTRSYQGYDRSWEIQTPSKPPVRCSNDPDLGGDPALHNPEDLLLASLSSCHMLWYLHLAARAGIEVVSYEDSPVGEGETERNGAGRFTRAILHPTAQVIRGADLERARQLHGEVHRYCYIARSVNFPVDCEPSFIEVESS
jgi:organic hydroperoxide reductase OsmC/OhrA